MCILLCISICGTFQLNIKYITDPFEKGKYSWSPCNLECPTLDHLVKDKVLADFTNTERNSSRKTATIISNIGFLFL